MFPPMDRLQKLGMSLDDLENNAKAIPAWRNRKSILGAILNVSIGFLVSLVLETGLDSKCSLVYTGVERVSFILQPAGPDKHTSGVCPDTKYHW